MTHANSARGQLAVVLATVFVNVIAVTLLTLAPWSNWRTGLALNCIDNVILLVYIARTKDALIGKLMVFGLIVGFAELAADAWLVDSTRTLDYSVGGGPMLWRSPIWMPLAWQIVCVQFGYIGLRLWERMRIAGSILTGLLGAVNIPYYEEMARRIHWWRYSGCRMISGTPWYIIVGELLIAVMLAGLAIAIKRGKWMTTVLAGIAGGVGIYAAYAVAFLLTDGWPK